MSDLQVQQRARILTAIIVGVQSGLCKIQTFRIGLDSVHDFNTILRDSRKIKNILNPTYILL